MDADAYCDAELPCGFVKSPLSSNMMYEVMCISAISLDFSCRWGSVALIRGNR